MRIQHKVLFLLCNLLFWPLTAGCSRRAEERPRKEPVSAESGLSPGTLQSAPETTSKPVQPNLIDSWGREAGRIETVSLNGPDDGSLAKFLKENPRVRKFEINQKGSVNSSGFQELSRLKELDSVTISHLTKETAEGLSHLKQVRKLSLYIRSDTINADSLRPLSEMTNVTSLTLGLGYDRRNDSDDALGAEALTFFPQITDLTLSNFGIGRKTLKSVSQLPRLESLSISSSSPYLTGQEISGLIGCPNLKSFACSSIGDDGMDAITQISSLRLLSGFSRLTDSGMVYLPRLKSLETLEVRSTGITDESLPNLRLLTDLRKLLILSPLIDGHSFKDLSGLDKLESLCLQRTGLTSENLQYLAELKSLEYLDIAYTKVDATNNPHDLIVLRKAPKLKRLHVEHYGPEAYHKLQETLPGVQIEFFE